MESKVSPLSLAPAFAVLLGICVSFFVHDCGYSATVSVTASVFSVSAWVLCGSSRLVKNWISLCLFTIFFVILFSCVSLYRINIKTVFPDTVDCQGTVLSVRPWGKNCALLISTDYGRVTVYTNCNAAPASGAKIRLKAAVFDFKKAEKPGAFDEEKYWEAKGAKKKCTVLKLESIGAPNLFYRWRNFLDKRIKERLPEKSAQYMAAITLGEKSRELAELHRKSGTSHLLAVSGFHVAILAGIGYVLFRKNRYRIVVISLLVWFYVFLSGCAPGAMRAAFMLQFALLSIPAGAPVSSFNSVSLAGVLLLLINPYSYYDIGFRLSLLASLFITSTVQNFGIISAALVSMLVWFVTAAQSAFNFQKIAAAGLFMNILAVPVFSLLFPLLAVCSLPALFGLPFGEIFAIVGEYLLEVWEIFARIFTEFVPWQFAWSPVMTAVSAFLFFFFAAEISGYGKNMRVFIASTASLVLVLLA